ncbi:MAG: FAD-dependent oxidoreductase [Deltaproteobacteria bacterium]|nr:FAD-dependent oxidoreductase [Deltaproteobacteria bacterium]
MKVHEVDLAIIGAGPAGMAAAISAWESGMEDIMLLERAEYPGGLLHQCIHNGFGLHYFEEDLTGPEYAERFIDRLASSNIKLCLNTMVTNFYPDRSMIAINPQWGEFKVVPKTVVLAMGCREKTRFAIGIPGSRPAGIFTAGLAQKLVNVDGYMPGKEIVVLGSGDIGMIMARRLTLEGAEVKAVVEIMPRVGGLIRNEVQCLHNFDIPLLLQHTITEIYGNYRVEGVKIAQVDGQGNPVKETERRVDCDCLLLSVGLIPENELSVEAGIELDQDIGGPVVDEFLQTSLDGVFAAGNVVQVWDLVDNVTLDGEKTGRNAARYVGGELKREPKEIKVIPGDNIATATPHKIVGSEPAEVALRVRETIERAEVRVGDFRKKFRVVSPTEVIKVILEPKYLNSFREKGEIKVSCHQRRKEDKEEGHD